MLIVTEVRAKSILNKSKVFDYCVNPYTGCEHSCAYCYAALFMRRYSGHSEPWGKFVDVKVNAPEVLKKQLVKAKKGTVWVASVCDPYQPLEERYQLTRKCLEELAEQQFPVNIQTKSALILRDLDVLQQFHEIQVGFTIATDEERMRQLFEPKASPVQARLDALEKIHQKGIRTFAFIGPILPGNPKKLVGSLEGKVDEILIDRMNYVSSLRKFYHQHNLIHASTDRFFDEYRRELVDELKKRRMQFSVLF